MTGMIVEAIMAILLLQVIPDGCGVRQVAGSLKNGFSARAARRLCPIKNLISRTS